MIKQSKNGILEEPSILGRSWCTNIGHLLKFTLKLLAHRPWISDEYLNVHVWYLCCECCFSIRYALTSVHRQPQVWVGNLHMWWKWPKPQEISLWGAKNHAEINTHSANANLTGVVEWRNAIWLPVRNIFRGNVGLTGCFVYIAVPGDRWGTEGSVGVLEVLLFTFTLLFHKAFLKVGFGCTNQHCWPWRWGWNRGTITLMSLLENVSAQPGFIYSLGSV